MAAKSSINLVPTEVGAKAETLGISKVLRQITIIVVFIFVVAAALGGAFLVLTSTQIASSKARSEQIKVSIKSLEGTEQALFLVRDRVGGIKNLVTDTLMQDNLEFILAISGGLPPGVSLSEVEAEGGKMKFSFIVTDSSSLPTLMNTFVNSEGVDSVVLKDFGFNASIGYLVGLEVHREE